MSIIASIVEEWDGKNRRHVTGTLAFSGNYVAAGVALNFGTAGIHSDSVPTMIQVPVYRGYIFEYVAGTNSRDGKLMVFGAGNAAATGTLTSDNTNVAADETVTIGTQVYTFKDALSADPTVPNEVLIGADADGSLANLVKAINGTGTPGTEYSVGTPVNANVTAGAVGAHATTVTAKVSGTAANAVATTETSAHLSWAQVTLTGGVNSTATANELSAAAFPTDLQGFAVPFYGIFPKF